MPHFEEIEAILTKIEGKTLTNDPNEAIISFENTPLTRGYDFLTQLYQAIRDEQVLRITYKAFQATAVEIFTMHPYYLKEYRERWYIFGLIAEKDTIYNLALDRITAIEETKSRYKTNRLFEPAHYFNDIVGVTRPSDVPVQTILVRVNALTAHYLQTRPIHASQGVVESHTADVLFEYQLIPNFEFVAEVLRLGEAAEVIAPPSLRQLIGEKIKKLVNSYSR